MPKAVSPSSSEDEAEASPTEAAVGQTESVKKSSSFQCPADFVTFSPAPCSSTAAERLKDPKHELWLIKAPLSFSPECFSGVKVPLAGLQTLEVPADGENGGQQVYSVLASGRGPAELRLLTAARGPSGRAVLAPAFSGLLNVCESFGAGGGVTGATGAPRVVPAPPPPSIPPGLKQRFHPFGSKTPTLTCVAENEADGAAFGPSSATLRPLVVKRFVDDVAAAPEDEDEEEGRRRKKKKKEKQRIKTERLEPALRIKQEPAAEPEEEKEEEEAAMVVDVDVDPPEEKRKKKKKKKDREREEVEEGLEPSVSVKQEAVAVKSEPADAWYEHATANAAANGSAKKKKKKKKKSKTEDE